MVTLKHFCELIFNPFFILVLSIVVCTVLVSKRKQIASKILFGLCLFTLLFSTGWVPRYLTERLESSYPVVTQVSQNIKWVVVLGGGHTDRPGLSENNLLTSASQKRLIEGLRLFRQLPHAKLLLSGGGESPQFTEAYLLQQLSIWLSVPPKRIVLDNQSLNTAEQAKTLVSLVRQEPFYLVTSAIHMPRSMQLCQQQGLKPIAAPTDFTFFWSDHNPAKMYIPNAYNFYYLTVAMHEFLGRTWMWVKDDKV